MIFFLFLFCRNINFITKQREEVFPLRAGFGFLFVSSVWLPSFLSVFTILNNSINCHRQLNPVRLQIHLQISSSSRHQLMNLLTSLTRSRFTFTLTTSIKKKRFYAAQRSTDNFVQSQNVFCLYSDRFIFVYQE